MKNLIKVIVVFGGILFVFGVLDVVLSPPSSSHSNSQVLLSVSNLKIERDEEHSGLDIPSTWYVAGTVTNNSNKQFSYVQVEINLYDEAGAQVESTMANAANLESHGTWEFRALILSDNWSTARLKSVSGLP